MIKIKKFHIDTVLNSLNEDPVQISPIRGAGSNQDHIELRCSGSWSLQSVTVSQHFLCDFTTSEVQDSLLCGLYLDFQSI